MDMMIMLILISIMMMMVTLILMDTFPLKRCAELVWSAQFLMPAPTFGKT